jgi:hypothetical protein
VNEAEEDIDPYVLLAAVIEALGVRSLVRRTLRI